MKWTNQYNVPQPLFEALTADKYEKTTKYSVTEIISSPQLIQLRKRHGDGIIQECTDATWRVLGSCIHDLIARQSSINRLHEERITMHIEGASLSGQPDLVEIVDGKTLITDYKVTSVFSFLLGVKREWAQQLNIYAHLLRTVGFTIDSLQIVAILRDWMYAKSGTHGYPPCPIFVQPILLLENKKVESFIHDRIALHEDSEKKPDSQLPPCTAAERWARPDSFAVVKDRGKRAFRVFDNREEAEATAAEKSQKNAIYNVIFRPGENVRCERFCEVAPFCQQGGELDGC